MLLAGLLILSVGAPGCLNRSTSPSTPTALVEPGFIPRPVPFTGIENTFQLGPRLWSGGEPHDDASFAALARAGIQTLVSVDGARTDLDAARRHGLRYLHVPIGYDGIPPAALAQLTAVADTVEGGIYVHCHHGRHRGPAAASVLALATGAWDADRAIEWLQQAGTAPEYPGLFRAARDYRRPDPGTVRHAVVKLVPQVTPDDQVASMVAIDSHAETLADMKSAGWRTLDTAPDETPTQVARLFREQFTEMLRPGLATSDDPDFIHALRVAETAAIDLERAIAAADPAAADRAWKVVRENCTSCHRRWRNSR